MNDHEMHGGTSTRTPHDAGARQPMVLTLFGEESRVWLSLEAYPSTAATAVLLLDDDGEEYATLSVNLEAVPVPTGRQFWLKDWTENAEIARILEEQGYIAPVPGVPAIPSGFVAVRLYELTTKADSAIVDENWTGSGG